MEIFGFSNLISYINFKIKQSIKSNKIKFMKPEDELIILLSDQINQLKLYSGTTKKELIKEQFQKMHDLSMISKIELGDDVITEINRLQELIKLK